MAKKLNDLLAEYGTVRDGIKDLQAQEKELNTLKRELESQIAIRMTEEGLDKISNGGRTISLKNEIVPDVQDWDALQQHVAETGEFEPLHRRVSATAYREKVALGTSVPGVADRELTRINYRST